MPLSIGVPAVVKHRRSGREQQEQHGGPGANGGRDAHDTGTPPTLPSTPETGRTLDELVSSASLWTQGQRITSQASLTSTEPSHVIGIPLHEAIPGVFFSPQVISPRDELQQHRSAALHSAAIAAAAATSAAAAASSVARSFAAAYDLPLAGLASVPTGLASCATAPAQPGHASMVDTTSPTDLLQRLRTAGVLTAGEVARSEACVQQFSPSARLDSLDSLVLAASTSSLASWLLEILDDDQLIPVDLATAPAHASAVVRRGRCSDMQPSGGSLARPSQEPEAASEEREAPAKETADGLRSSGGATRTEAPRASADEAAKTEKQRELLAKLGEERMQLGITAKMLCQGVLALVPHLATVMSPDEVLSDPERARALMRELARTHA